MLLGDHNKCPSADGGKLGRPKVLPAPGHCCTVGPPNAGGKPGSARLDVDEAESFCPSAALADLVKGWMNARSQEVP